MLLRIMTLGFFLAASLTGSQGWAQGPVNDVATVKLQALQQRLQQRSRADDAAVAALARRLGIERRRVLPNGKVLELQRVGSDGRPVFYITNNYDAADTVSTDELWPGGAAGLNLTGSGMTLGEWDAGAVEVDHPDLWPRATQIDDPNHISDHATHVAGTLIGSGGSVYLQARGMAYQADLHAYDWNNNAQEMVAAALAGMRVSNHSYGIAAGWVALGGTPPDNWWWFGGFADEDPNFGYYNEQAELWDQIAYDAPHFLIVNAAGNDRWDIGPEPGSDEEFRIVDPNGIEIGRSTDAPPPDCGQDSYDCLPPGGVAKNILTVGAVDDVPGGYEPLAGPSSVQMTGFSSWGPTDDGRIKPDLVANGWMLFSTYPWDPYFASAIGTSMAAPNVSGSLLLLQQHYANLNAGAYLRAATLKGLAIHTADEAGDAAGPDYEYGWGLLNTYKAAQFITGQGAGVHWLVEGSLADGAAEQLPIDITQDGARVTATLVWHDPPGVPVLPPVLDPTALMLVNDLDLRASGNGDTHLPWLLNPAQPGATATRGDNVRDNVEQVEFTASVGSYTLSVAHKGVLAAPQAYSLLVSIAPPAPSSTGLAIDEDFAEGVLPPGWTTATNNVSWQVHLPVNGGGRYDNNTGGNGGFAMLDNDFAKTVASLTLPPLDMSATESAVLRFRNSYPYYDTFETLNVETSTDGGSNWSNRLSIAGFYPFPFSSVVDLSTAIAGQSNVRIRFLWDSGPYPGGDVWQLDDVELETFGAQPPPPPPDTSDLPGLAADPVPTDGASEVSEGALLTWSKGPLAQSHKVYLGTSSALDGGDYRTTVTGNQYDPGTLAGDTTYFWRIDEANTAGETQGNTWSFTTASAPEPPATPGMHVYDLDADSQSQPRNRWQATATIRVGDEGGQPLTGAAVTGQWSNGANGSVTCYTLGSSGCDLVKGNLKAGVAAVSLTVTSVVLDGYSYQSGDNADGESDSDGTVITISKDGGAPANTAPGVSISSPANGAIFASADNPLSLQASASDAEDIDDAVVTGSIVWRTGGLEIGAGGNASHTFAEGSHTITATATDSEGATGSDTVTITVDDGGGGGGGGGGGTGVHVFSMGSESVTLDSRRWSAQARVVVYDDSGPVSGATVNAGWSNGAKGSASCSTGAGGDCLLSKSLKQSVTNVTLTINSISNGGVDYPPGANDSLVLTLPP